MAFGITDTGFVLKRLEDIKTELEAEYQANYGPIDINADSVLGVIIGVESKALADLWEGLQAVYNSLYPASASGVSLDNVSDLTGLARLSATKSEGVIQATGDNGTVLPVARVVSVTGTEDKFETTNAVTIEPASCVRVIISIGTVSNSTLYTVTINGTAFDFTSDIDATAQEIITGLESAINGGAEPVTATDLGDETLRIEADDLSVAFVALKTTEITWGAITSNVPVESQDFGPIVGLSGTITVIETPVSGWDSVNNALDVTLGRDDETDTSLRLRRISSLQVSGAGTVESIRSRLLQVDNVTGAFVEENTTTVTDGSGRPPKSFEAIVAGGADQDIADLIWEVKPAGIATYGTEAVVVTDSMGNDHTINFSRATEIFIWVRVTITQHAEETYPIDGDNQVTADVAAFGITHQIGNDVLVQRFHGYIHDTPGIKSALVEIATSATAGGPPGSYQTTDLAIANTEVAVFDSSRITIL